MDENITEKNEDVNDEIIDQTIKELSEIFASSDETLVYEFIRCLFTPAELKDIANRWLLVKEIDKGTTQREIAKQFRMSLCKITRGSKELSKPDSAFRKILDLQKNK
ncbi:MAG: trp operon repressor [Treponema sp.]|nr:trp operon repressor [Treponema sp.]